MGYLGQPDAPEVRDAIAGAAATLARMDKPWGILVGSPKLAGFYASLGAAFVAAGSDLGLLRKSADDLAATLRSGTRIG
jgi:2-keto-3-deoxy-L-rhamnonate aldolase RhmA